MRHNDPIMQRFFHALSHPHLANIDLSLDRIRSLLGALGNPQDALPPVVHVAGTNAKGSLLAYLMAMLEAAGYRVHRYISPHLVEYNERIRLAGADISDAALVDALARVERATAAHPVTFFEALTAAAYLAMREMPADIVLLETGLGGRLDATNVLAKPLLTAITPVGMDHMEYLGPTLAAIAGEKAGILKRGVPCVIGLQEPEAMNVIERKALETGAPLYRRGKEWQVKENASGFHFSSPELEADFPLPGLAGSHQVSNAALAVACATQLHGFTIPLSAMQGGVAKAVWPARMQRITQGKLAKILPPGSELWLDGGHNPAAGEVISLWMRAQKKPVHLVCGMMARKDTKGFLTSLAPHAASLTAIPIEGESEALAPEDLANIARELEITTTCKGCVSDAIQYIVKNVANDVIILACGSLYLAGNILWENGK